METNKNLSEPSVGQPDYNTILEQKAYEYFGRQFMAKTYPELIKSANFFPTRNFPLQEMQDPNQKARELESGAAWRTKAKYIDPTYNLLSWTGARVKPSSISFLTLRLMSYKCVPVRAIINLRREQVPQIEWEIRLKNAKKKPNPVQQEKIEYLTRLFKKPVDNPYRKITWSSFIKSCIEDRLSLDAMCFEKVRNRRGMIKELWNCDGATIKPNMNEYGEYDRTEAYIQEINGIKAAAFTYDELAYCIGNPRTDIYSYGYGYSELESLIEMVTAILFVDKYNRSYFSNNSIPQGVMSLVGEIDPQDLEMFKRYWIAETKGIDNFWKMPIVNVPDKSYMNWQKFKDSNSDMQYNIYYDWLIRLVCAVYQTDPAEINIHGQPGVGGVGQGGSSTVAKVEYSKSKGLRSILKFLKETFDTEVIDEVYPDEFELFWSGVEAESRPEKVELRTKEINSGYKTINELREEDHLEPLPWGDIPGNPTIANIYIQEKMAKDQQAAMSGTDQGGEQPGEEGAEPGQEEEGQPSGQEGIEEKEPGADGGGPGITEPKATQKKDSRGLSDPNAKNRESIKNSNIQVKSHAEGISEKIKKQGIGKNTIEAAKSLKKSVEDNESDTITITAEVEI